MRPTVTSALLLSLPLAAQAASPVDILTHTPVWVFAILAFLLNGGIRAARQRRASLPRLLITPTIFCLWGISSLASRADPLLAALWLGGALAGAALAYLLPRPVPLEVDRGSLTLLLPGSWLPLIRVLVLFSAKYGLGVAMATHPDQRATLLTAHSCVSGLSAGYFLLMAAHYVSYFVAHPALIRLRRGA